jgi:prevent-host-death family protein
MRVSIVLDNRFFVNHWRSSSKKYHAAKSFYGCYTDPKGGYPMRMIDIQEAKAHFSELVDAVAHGSEILIAIAGKPVAKLVPISKKTERRFGVLRGKIKISKDFYKPLPEEMINSFEGQ